MAVCALLDTVRYSDNPGDVPASLEAAQEGKIISAQMDT